MCFQNKYKIYKIEKKIEIDFTDKNKRIKLK